MWQICQCLAYFFPLFHRLVFCCQNELHQKKQHFQPTRKGESFWTSRFRALATDLLSDSWLKNPYRFFFLIVEFDKGRFFFLFSSQPKKSSSFWRLLEGFLLRYNNTSTTGQTIKIKNKNIPNKGSDTATSLLQIQLQLQQQLYQLQPLQQQLKPTTIHQLTINNKNHRYRIQDTMKSWCDWILNLKHISPVLSQIGKNEGKNQWNTFIDKKCALFTSSINQSVYFKIHSRKMSDNSMDTKELRIHHASRHTTKIPYIYNNSAPKINIPPMSLQQYRKSFQPTKTSTCTIPTSKTTI